jgi:hypothetical protein
MAAGIFDLTGENMIEQGSDYELSVIVRYAPPVNSPAGTLGELFPLAGYTPHAMIRKTPKDPTPFLTFSCTVDESTSLITLKIPADTSSAVVVSTGVSYVWSLEIHHTSSAKIRVLKGEAEIDPEVTK